MSTRRSYQRAYLPKAFARIVYFQISLDEALKGTWNELNHSKKDLEKAGIPPEILAITELTREEVKNNIPKPLERPENWAPDFKFPFADIFNQIFQIKSKV